MADWSDTKILSTSFFTHSGPNGYEIHFSTPDREKYLAVQEECRRQIGLAKTTQADRIRSMTDEELAEYLIRDVEAEAIRRAGRYLTNIEIDRAVVACLDWLKQEVEL